MWRSGTSVIARRPLRASPSRTIVPVSAIAQRAAGQHAVDRVEGCRVERAVVASALNRRREPVAGHARGQNERTNPMALADAADGGGTEVTSVRVTVAR